VDDSEDLLDVSSDDVAKLLLSSELVEGRLVKEVDQDVGSRRLVAIVVKLISVHDIAERVRVLGALI